VTCATAEVGSCFLASVEGGATTGQAFSLDGGTLALIGHVLRYHSGINQPV
jgi:hypothetical protein